MTLRYIALRLNREQFSDDYRYEFKCHTRFISNFLSKSVRKIKFKTDESFDMISIDCSVEIEETKIVPFNALKIDLAFNQQRYEKLKGSDDYSYYLELLEEGFKKGSEYKVLPLNKLLSLIEDFRKGNCKNEWIHKRKKFREQDIEVALSCEFTTRHFQLVATISQISSKRELVKGVVLKTEPDEVLFEGMFKDIHIAGNNIIITDSADSPRITIKKDDTASGKLNFTISGDKDIVDMLTYKLKYT